MLDEKMGKVVKGEKKPNKKENRERKEKMELKIKRS